MTRDIGPIVCGILICFGLFILVTGIGGGGYSFRTGEWYISEKNTPTENRIVGAFMLGFGLLLPLLKRK